MAETLSLELHAEKTTASGLTIAFRHVNYVDSKRPNRASVTFSDGERRQELTLDTATWRVWGRFAVLLGALHGGDDDSRADLTVVSELPGEVIFVEYAQPFSVAPGSRFRPPDGPLFAVEVLGRRPTGLRLPELNDFLEIGEAGFGRVGDIVVRQPAADRLVLERAAPPRRAELGAVEMRLDETLRFDDGLGIHAGGLRLRYAGHPCVELRLSRGNRRRDLELDPKQSSEWRLLERYVVRLDAILPAKNAELPSLRLEVTKLPSQSFELGVPWPAENGVPAIGPDGLVVTWLGISHHHGTDALGHPKTWGHFEFAVGIGGEEHDLRISTDPGSQGRVGDYVLSCDADLRVTVSKQPPPPKPPAPRPGFFARLFRR